MLAMEETTSPSAAAAVHPLNSNPASTVALLGGDPVASNVITPFGGSQGLMYSWTGPSGFSSSLRNPTKSVEGTYNLTITEIRNGCQAIASTSVIRTPGIPLPVKLIDLRGTMDNNTVTLNWTAAENETVESFEIERSFDGTNFATQGLVYSTEKAGAENYNFYETVNNPARVYYRLKMYDKSNAVDYSKILVFEKETHGGGSLKILNNPTTDKLTFRFESGMNGHVDVIILDVAGRAQLKQKIDFYRGANVDSIPLPSTTAKGLYALQLSIGRTYTAKFIKQ